MAHYDSHGAMGYGMGKLPKARWLAQALRAYENTQHCP